MPSSSGEFIIPNKMPKRIYQGHIGRYEFAANFVRNKVVLDVACGTGYGSIFLVEKGAETVIGGDMNRDAIEYAKVHHNKERLDFVCLDATNLPFSEGIFDVIISFETIEHIKEYKKFLSACNRVLKRDGFFVCSTPNRMIFSPKLKMPLNPFHVCEFNVKEFCDLLNEYFKEVTIYSQKFLTLRNIIMYKLYSLGARLLSLTSFGRKIRIIVWKKSTSLKNFMWKRNFLVFSLSLRAEKTSNARYKVEPFNSDLSSRVDHIIATAQQQTGRMS